MKHCIIIRSKELKKNLLRGKLGLVLLSALILTNTKNLIPIGFFFFFLKKKYKFDFDNDLEIHHVISYTITDSELQKLPWKKLLRIYPQNKKVNSLYF